MIDLIKTIEEAWENRALLKESQAKDAVREVVNLLDKGVLLSLIHI